jgi:hypothetical protein
LKEKEETNGESLILELADKLGISISPKADVGIIDEMEDKELSELSTRFTGENVSTMDQAAGVQVICSSSFLRFQSEWLT